MKKSIKDLDELCPWLTKNLNDNQKESICLMIDEIGFANFMINGKLLYEIIHSNFIEAVEIISNIETLKKSEKLNEICTKMLPVVK